MASIAGNPEAVLPRPRAGKRRRARVREFLIACGFLAPNFIGFLVFTSLPVIASLALAFMRWDIISPPRWVGADNFATVLSSGDFWFYVWNTFFLMLRIPIAMAMSLGLALLLNVRHRGVSLYRAVFFLPSVVSGIAIYVLWTWILNADYGLLNRLLAAVGIAGPRWLENVHLAKPSLMIVGLWAGVGGYNMILYLAGLQGIDPELYEAAEIDGASRWQTFRHITWPLLSPTTFFVFVMSVIGGFQGGFEQAFIMTNGGPNGATTTVSYYIYTEAFVLRHMGTAAAAAWFLFVLILGMTLVNWRFGGKRVHY